MTRAIPALLMPAFTFIVSLTLSAPALAQIADKPDPNIQIQNQADNQKVDDLSTNVEAEEMDVYDQKMLDQQARRESQALERESRELEARMAQLRKQSQALSNKAGDETRRYAEYAKLARQARSQSQRMESQHNKLKVQVESLRAKAQQSRNRLESAQGLAKNLARDIREQSRERERLLLRQRLADTKIQRQAEYIRKLRTQKQKLTRDNNRLQQVVADRETRAGLVR